MASIPCSFLGGALRLPSIYYKSAVGVILLFAAFRLFHSAKAQDEKNIKRPPLFAALIAGAALGLLAGLTGTGGGIFLSPVLLLAGWSGVRECAGVSAAFVLVNSISGLAGNIASVRALPSEVFYLGAAAAIGGVIGSELGSRRLAPKMLQADFHVIPV
jgi:uncharacterized membrane protein YfcA